MNVLKKMNDEMIQKILEDSGVEIKKRCNEAETQEFQALLEAGKPLPNGVYCYEGGFGFYRLNDIKVDDEDLKRFIELRHLESLNVLKTIKKCVIFFVVTTLISVFLSLISFISISSVL